MTRTIGFGIIGILAAAGFIAQPQYVQAAQLNRRLAVHPREMATGTRNEKAGVSRIPVLLQHVQQPAFGGVPESATVFVPHQCVGPQRCPLLLFIWTPWQATMYWLTEAAEKYGIILLSPDTRYARLGSDDDMMPSAEGVELERKHLEATLKQVLQQFAIDPDKIAIMGTCATGETPVNIGGANYDVFNRIISLSGPPSPTTVRGIAPPTPKVEFFFDAGIDESAPYFEATRTMRDKGYRVTHAVGLRVHGHTFESYDHVGRWLRQTWASPDAAARPAAAADPPPLLTTDALAKVTAFWTRFLQEPDSIRMTGRRAHLREVAVPVGTERPIVVMVDMAALAAAYPSVAADLKAAGLTAQEHDAYRVAMISARAFENVGSNLVGTLDPGSSQAKNVAFMDAHPDEFQKLEDTSNGYSRTAEEGLAVLANMWTMP